MANPKHPVGLIILDGWGIGEAGDPMNAIRQGHTPHMDRLKVGYPHNCLRTSGHAVGLPEGQMGNSEVGHLNIGAGRVVYQELTRISKAIQEGDFFTNQTLTHLLDKLTINRKPLHLLGLVSDGGVHSHIKHLYALLEMAQKYQISEVWIHCFLDGRDVAPQSGLGFIQELQNKIDEIGIGQIGTVSGRYYGMDRDKRWEREQLAYDAIVLGKGVASDSPEKAVEQSYKLNVNDEFVKPTVVGNYSGMEEGTGAIFFNFRPDRARQFTRILTDARFTEIDRGERGFVPIEMVTFTQYEEGLDVDIAYPPQEVSRTLGQVVSEQGLKQLRMAETEKYAHVTFFFNGGEEVPSPGEERILIPSPKVATYDLEPKMRAVEVTNRLLEELAKEEYSLFIVNFANGDMVGHTGVFSAAVEAVETVDQCVGRIAECIIEMNGSLIITADHGNAEKMRDTDGTPWTAHTTNPVPVILVSKSYQTKTLHEGILADLAPTLLELLRIPVPIEMTGKSLINK